MSERGWAAVMSWCLGDLVSWRRRGQVSRRARTWFPAGSVVQDRLAIRENVSQQDRCAELDLGPTPIVTDVGGAVVLQNRAPPLK